MTGWAVNSIAMAVEGSSPFLPILKENKEKILIDDVDFNLFNKGFKEYCFNKIEIFLFFYCLLHTSCGRAAI